MPFKTGLGTAGLDPEHGLDYVKRFQCPLRRAWVLRGKKLIKVGDGTIRFQCPLRRAWVLRDAEHFPSERPDTVFQCPLRRAWVLRDLGLALGNDRLFLGFNAL